LFPHLSPLSSGERVGVREISNIFGQIFSLLVADEKKEMFFAG